MQVQVSFGSGVFVAVAELIALVTKSTDSSYDPVCRDWDLVEQDHGHGRERSRRSSPMKVRNGMTATGSKLTQE